MENMPGSDGGSWLAARWRGDQTELNLSNVSHFADDVGKIPPGNLEGALAACQLLQLL